MTTPNTSQAAKGRPADTAAMLMKNLAIVVATKDRPDELQNLLSSIRSQSCQPSQMIVVDGGDEPVSGVVEQFSDLNIDHIKVYPPRLTKQKNAGVAGVRPNIELIGFLDDDIVLEENSLAEMMKFWDAASDRLGGASFNLPDFNTSGRWLKSIPQRLFLIDNRDFGKVLRSGFNTAIWNTSEDRTVEWLGGGYTVWRRKVFNQWEFDEWYPGSGLWEDVHFSYRVGKEYDLAIVAEAKDTQVDPPPSAIKQVSLGKTQTKNWIYFVKSNSDLSTAMCLWACVGRTGVNFAKGVESLNLGFILKAWGNLLGLVIGAASRWPRSQNQ